VTKPQLYRSLHRCLAGALLTLTATTAFAQAATSQPTVDAAGSVHATDITIPISNFLSPEARADLEARLKGPSMVDRAKGGGMLALRAIADVDQQKLIERWQKIYPSDITTEAMGGVRTHTVTPKAGIAPENRNRVLVNLHGGGFFLGSRFGGQLEAIPVAGRGRIKVITVDYRLAPENKFPAAHEDVERVYRELLKTYKPDHIGFFGCSAGGTLVGQSVAWFQSRHLPRPAAVGIFCAGLMPTFWFGGDSQAMTPAANGQAQFDPTGTRPGTESSYFDGIDLRNPLIEPAEFPQILAKFPPTLLLTGTRDVAMSNALITNARLLQAGVETQLLVQDGLGHGEFGNMPGTPEATLAFDVIWRFFDRHLSR
jgi:monoterpene epsilon-lactone hydrolase